MMIPRKQVIIPRWAGYQTVALRGLPDSENRARPSLARKLLIQEHGSID